MKNFMNPLVIVLLCFSQIANGSESGITEFNKKVSAIISKYPGNADKTRAQKCSAFGDLLSSYADSKEYKVISLAGIQTVAPLVKSLKTPEIKEIKESNLNDISELFQSCNFIISKPIGGNFCGDCIGSSKFSNLVYTKQKTDKHEFLVHPKIATNYGNGLLLSPSMYLVNSKFIKDQGDGYIFPVYSGTQKVTMSTGFEKEIDTALDLGSESMSSIFCYFNKYKKAMKEKYGKSFNCAYVTPTADFYGSTSAQVLCAPNSDVRNGKIQGLTLHNFDYEYCK